MSLHFEGGIYGAFGLDDYKSKDEFGAKIKHALIAVISEGVEAKATIKSFSRGFHVPYYGWRELACIFLGRLTSEVILGFADKSVPDVVQKHLKAQIAQIAREKNANRKFMGRD